MTWPPVRPSSWYSSANQEDGCSASKLVFSAASPSLHPRQEGGAAASAWAPAASAACSAAMVRASWMLAQAAGHRVQEWDDCPRDEQLVQEGVPREGFSSQVHKGGTHLCRSCRVDPTICFTLPCRSVGEPQSCNAGSAGLWVERLRQAAATAAKSGGSSHSHSLRVHRAPCEYQYKGGTARPA